MRITSHSKSCQIIVNKKFFNFQEFDSLSTADTTPDSINTKEKPQFTYFKNSIPADSQIARELHEASLQSNWYIEASQDYVKKRTIKLKKQKFEKVVVLDLDETLIFYKNEQTIVRPFCQQFLDRLSLICVPVLFTAAKKEHAINMLKIIDPKKKYFKAVCSQEHMIGDVKDLRIFQTDLKDILIVENSPKKFIAQINNGVPILPFTGQADDNQLEQLLSFLEIILLSDDVRVQLSDYFKIDQFHKQLNGRQAISKLYKHKHI